MLVDYYQVVRSLWCIRQGAIKYGRLAEFLPGKPDFNRKFGLFWPILANNHKKNSIPLTESINFSQEILISCFVLPGSQKNYSALKVILLNLSFFFQIEISELKLDKHLTWLKLYYWIYHFFQIDIFFRFFEFPKNI